MAQYRVTNRNGGVATIEAERYDQDGSGTRFYDANGHLVASFYDGELSSTVPASVEFTAPAPEGDDA